MYELLERSLTALAPMRLPFLIFRCLLVLVGAGIFLQFIGTGVFHNSQEKNYSFLIG